MRMTVCRKGHFNAAHRLHNPALTDQENEVLFGKCNYPHYHGHNYDLIVKVTGEVNPKTGYVMDMKVLSDLIEKLVVEDFDHKNLNLDVEEFKTLIPSAEHIAYIIWHRLKPHLPESFELLIVLYETPRNFVEYAGN